MTADGGAFRPIRHSARPGRAGRPLRCRTGGRLRRGRRPGRLPLRPASGRWLPGGLARRAGRQAQDPRVEVGQRPAIEPGQDQPGEGGHVVGVVIGAPDRLALDLEHDEPVATLRLDRQLARPGPCTSGSAGHSPGTLRRGPPARTLTTARPAGQGAINVQRLPVSSPQVSQQCGSASAPSAVRIVADRIEDLRVEARPCPAHRSASR